MPETAELVAILKAIGLVAAAATAAYILATAGRHWPVLPPQRRRAVAWGGPACLLVFLLATLPPEVLARLLTPLGIGPADDPSAVKVYLHCAAKLIALPLQLAVGLAGLAAFAVPRYQVRFGRVRPALALGVTAWVGVLLATYGVNVATFLLYRVATGNPPDEHPILRTMVTHGGRAVAAVFVAESCLAAPLREEIFFRGFLQPWLAKHEAGAALGLVLAALAGYTFGAENWFPAVAFAAALAPVAFVLDRWSARGMRWLLPVRDGEARRRAVGAVVGSAALFANFHAFVWPLPVPMFVFGLGVGWLAYRTQSLGPALVVHVLFNAVATSSILLR